MKRLLYASLLLALLQIAAGCAMCAHPWDDAYNTYGGKWQRHDMFNGRVNSAFAPAGGGTIVEGDVTHGHHAPAPTQDEAYQIHDGDLEPTADMSP